MWGRQGTSAQPAGGVATLIGEVLEEQVEMAKAFETSR